jgi:hypothetical protein
MHFPNRQPRNESSIAASTARFVAIDAHFHGRIFAGAPESEEPPFWTRCLLVAPGMGPLWQVQLGPCRHGWMGASEGTTQNPSPHITCRFGNVVLTQGAGNVGVMHPETTSRLRNTLRRIPSVEAASALLEAIDPGAARRRTALS